MIANVKSGKALDVRGAAAGNNAVVQQYALNGSNAQRCLFVIQGLDIICNLLLAIGIGSERRHYRQRYRDSLVRA